ncbi:glucan biosynthesis protein [Roseobacter weihaiensis]|uniref:glucan biosynthesis protein n=1 Tax=Roseobacter weihaiensis TaxID=2763262 RepID=UPI003873C9FB
MLRRDVLKSLAALATAPTAALADAATPEPGLQQGTATPFTAELVRTRAQALAQTDYTPRPYVPESWRNLSYDQYRKIWFDGRNALWQGTEGPQRVDLLPPGLYFPQPVEINVVQDGQARPLLFDLGVFDSTDKFPEVEVDDTLGYSGLRLRAELQQPGIFQEYAVFQGASYFRGIGAGETYGLSARGLALNTAEPEGEEFPDFIAFWLETPKPGARSVVLHALLDSPSCTGAYRFKITHGETLTMAVEAEIFARQELLHVGIAPLTSMFLFDETMRERFSDFRPAVHDSDGLMIHNGAGEVIWRPLSNPKHLQISAFADDSPRGFGLMQRARAFSDFADLEALYHNRPALWVTPGEDWGPGSVTLVEIPADLEVYDNIVSYWRPAAPIPAGASHRMSYRLDWADDPAPRASMPLRVLNTAIGDRPEGGKVVIVDFEARADVPEDLTQLDIVLRSSSGEMSQGLVQRNPETGGPRLAFTFYPQEAELIEFRAQLRLEGAALTEVWLYRWTRA